MEMRKGFVYTLEAIMASSLILTMVIVVLPEAGPEIKPDLSTVDSGLKTLEEDGSLEKNLTNQNILQEIDQYAPSSFNHTNVVHKSKNNISSISSSEEVYMNGSGSSADIQLWIESPSNLDITFRDQTVFEQVNEPGYYESTLGDTKGWLNFSGTGNVEYSFNTYQSYGNSPEAEEVFSKNLLTYYEGDREVQIFIW